MIVLVEKRWAQTRGYLDSHIQSSEQGLLYLGRQCGWLLETALNHFQCKICRKSSTAFGAFAGKAPCGILRKESDSRSKLQFWVTVKSIEGRTTTLKYMKGVEEMAPVTKNIQWASTVWYRASRWCWDDMWKLDVSEERNSKGRHYFDLCRGLRTKLLGLIETFLLARSWAYTKTNTAAELSTKKVIFMRTGAIVQGAGS